MRAADVKRIMQLARMAQGRSLKPLSSVQTTQPSCRLLISSVGSRRTRHRCLAGSLGSLGSQPDSWSWTLAKASASSSTRLASTAAAAHLQTWPLVDGYAILAELNDEQRAAVLSTHQHNRVLAGPGSGKTRVVAARVAHLVAGGVHPDSILAITFTNKAADELRKRVLSAVGRKAARKVTAGTFHSLAMRILRRDIHCLPSSGRDSEFLVFDEDDCVKLMKKALPRLWPDDPNAKKDVDELLSAVSSLKNSCASVHGMGGEQLVAVAAARGIEPVASFMRDKLAAFYDIYTAEMCAVNALDFDDLLSLTVALLRTAPEVQTRLQSRWRQLLVDEFQDTNLAQYEMVTLMTGENSYLFVVGDPNQAIYSWRGAHPEHLNHSMMKHYHGVGTFPLACNYRSTSPIIRAAEAVLCGHKRPPLHRDAVIVRGQEAEPCVVLHQTTNEYAQADVVGAFAKARKMERRKLSELAVLYRTNVEANLLESRLLEQGVPHHISGSTALWQRAEVKDAMALLRLVAKTEDVVALDRVLDLPVCKGLGKTTLKKLEEAARGQGLTLPGLLLHNIDSAVPQPLSTVPQPQPLSAVPQPLSTVPQPQPLSAVPQPITHQQPWSALSTLIDEQLVASAPPLQPVPGVKLTTAQALAIARLRGLIARARQRAVDGSVETGLSEVLLESGYTGMLQQKAQVEEEARRAGQKLKEKSAKERLRSLTLVAVVACCPETYGLDSWGEGDGEAATSLPAGREGLQKFLDFAQLKSEPADNAREDAVQLMSLHAAKGKEFDEVLMIGCDKLPAIRKDDTRPDALAEETRLCYVGMTRARNHLAMLWPAERKQWNQSDSDSDTSEGLPPFIKHIIHSNVRGVQQVGSYGGPSWWSSASSYGRSSSSYSSSSYSSSSYSSSTDSSNSYSSSSNSATSSYRSASSSRGSGAGSRGKGPGSGSNGRSSSGSSGRRSGPQPARPQTPQPPPYQMGNYPLSLPPLPQVGSTRKPRHRSSQ